MSINTGESTKDTEINNEVADGNDNYVRRSTQRLVSGRILFLDWLVSLARC